MEKVPWRRRTGPPVSATTSSDFPATASSFQNSYAGGSSDEDDTVGAYQAILGLGTELSRNVTLILEYRYFAAPNVQALGSGTLIQSNYYSHNGLLGVRIGF